MTQSWAAQVWTLTLQHTAWVTMTLQHTAWVSSHKLFNFLTFISVSLRERNHPSGSHPTHLRREPCGVNNIQKVLAQCKQWVRWSLLGNTGWESYLSAEHTFIYSLPNLHRWSQCKVEEIQRESPAQTAVQVKHFFLFQSRDSPAALC